MGAVSVFSRSHTAIQFMLTCINLCGRHHIPQFLDGMDFAPIAKCVDGCEVLGKIEMKYREKPNQGTIQNKGNEYLKADFPDLDYITGAFFE